MKGWSADHIESLQARGMKVNYSSAPSPDRSVTIQCNGKTETVKIKKTIVHAESELQQNCVKAFRFTYPKLKMRLFSIPNEAIRSTANASRMLSQGLLPGAWDMILAIPNGKYGAAFMEFKSKTGRLTDHQKIFLKEMEGDYYFFLPIRSVEQFLKEVNQYLNDKL